MPISWLKSFLNSCATNPLSAPMGHVCAHLRHRESDTASKSEVTQKELEFIQKLKSNDPAIGYNQWPRLKG
jgi:hypothetical protein